MPTTVTTLMKFLTTSLILSVACIFIASCIGWYFNFFEIVRSPIQAKPWNQSVQFDRVESNTERSFNMIYSNYESKDIRVVGFEGACTKQGCVTIQSLPMVIPAKKKVAIPYTIHARDQGDFKVLGRIYLDRGVIDNSIITFKGRILP